MSGKRDKCKWKLASSQSPASVEDGASHGTSANPCASSLTKVSPYVPIFPPIVIPDNCSQILSAIRSALSSTPVEAKCSGNSLKLVVKSTTDFRVVQNYLRARKISFHTFAPPEEREVKVVFQGIPYHIFSDTNIRNLPLSAIRRLLFRFCMLARGTISILSLIHI